VRDPIGGHSHRYASKSFDTRAGLP